jgi:hypothetical protein
VRFTNLCASGAIAASLLLSACSSGSGSSQALPSSSQAVAPMAHSAQPMGHSAHLIVVGAKHFTASCDTSIYITCVTVAKGSPAVLEFCVNFSGSGCSSGYFPSIAWYKKIIGSFYPNPGNPSDDTITAKKKVRNSHGKVTYYQYIEGCYGSGSGSCVTGLVGIATQ